MDGKNLGNILSPTLVCEYCGDEYMFSARAIFRGVEYSNTHHCTQKKEGVTLSEVEKITQKLLSLKEDDIIKKVEPINLNDLTSEDLEQIKDKDGLVGNGNIYACWLVSWSPRGRNANIPTNRVMIVKTNSITKETYMYVTASAKSRVL